MSQPGTPISMIQWGSKEPEHQFTVKMSMDTLEDFVNMLTGVPNMPRSISITCNHCRFVHMTGPAHYTSSREDCNKMKEFMLKHEKCGKDKEHVN